MTDVQTDSATQDKNAPILPYATPRRRSAEAMCALVGLILGATGAGALFVFEWFDLGRWLNTENELVWSAILLAFPILSTALALGAIIPEYSQDPHRRSWSTLLMALAALLLGCASGVRILVWS